MGLFFYRVGTMRIEPAEKRAIAFFDGQNLFHSAKAAFGYAYPNFDPQKLAAAVASAQGWRLTGTRFYTGVPSADANARWHSFWTAKLAVLGTRGVHAYTRPLRYRNQTVTGPAGITTVLVGQEKGIDVRIALDVVRLAIEGAYDVAVIFSQDQDLTEAVTDVKELSAREQRWIKLASAYPWSPATPGARGINGTDWIRIDRATYDACLDPNDYRPREGP